MLVVCTTWSSVRIPETAKYSRLHDHLVVILQLREANVWAPSTKIHLTSVTAHYTAMVKDRGVRELAEGSRRRPGVGNRLGGKSQGVHDYEIHPSFHSEHQLYS